MPPSPTIQNDSSIKTTDESTPLLSTIEPEPLSPSDPLLAAIDEENDEVEDADLGKPLPKAQIFLLCYTSCVAPIAFFSIFPYINFMIEAVGGVEKEDVGFWSGFIESAFSAVMMCVMIAWGKASDRFGRKPTLVVSLLGMTFASTLFGLSQRLWQMILFRCVAGIFGGTIVTVRAMVSENSTKHTQARAFSFFAFAYNMGIFVGPLIGGALERPASKFPTPFFQHPFWHTYPYALPNIVVSAIALSAAISTMLFVKETLHIHHSNKEIAGPKMTTWELIKHPGVTPVLLVYNYVMMMATTFTAVFPVTQYTPIDLGGLGFTPGKIAATTGLNGVSQACWVLIVFPILHKRVGTGRVLWLCAVGWPVLFAAAPVFNGMLRYGLTTVFWSTGPPFIVLFSGVSMAFTGVQLALNDISPSHETLGTLNAIALAAQSGLRAVAPAVATSIYAVGVKYRILGGQLFWLCQIVLAFGLFGLLRLLPAKAKGEVKKGQAGRV